MAAWPDLAKHNLVFFQDESTIFLARLDKNSDIQGVEPDSILSIGFNEGSPGVFSFDALSGKINLAQFRVVFKDAILRSVDSMTHGIRLSLNEYHQNEVNPQWLWVSRDGASDDTEAGATQLAALTEEVMCRYAREGSVVLLPRKSGPFSVVARDADGGFVVGDSVYMDTLRQEQTAVKAQLQSTETASQEEALRQNFGEKIGGSAADKRRAGVTYYTQVIEDNPEFLSAKKFLEGAEVKLSTVWPKPDVGALLEQGVNPVIVAVTGYIYEALPSSPAGTSFSQGFRPKKYHQAIEIEAEAARSLRYALIVEGIKLRCESMINANTLVLKDVVGESRDGNDSLFNEDIISLSMRKSGIDMWSENAFTRLSGAIPQFNQVIDEVSLEYLISVMLPNNKSFSLDTWGLSSSGLIHLMRGKENGSAHDAFELVLVDSIRLLDDMFPLPEAKINASSEARQERHKILSQRRTLTPFVNLVSLSERVDEALYNGTINREDIEKNIYKMLPSFAKKEPKTKITDVALNEAVTIGKKIPSMHFNKFERTGPPVIPEGVIVSEKLFMETFGFRAIEYGEWVSQTDRQKMLDSAFESFMDISKALGVPSQFMGLEGTLAIAFGARGRGGKNAALAHYEHEGQVINLTKLTKNGGSGGGTIAHEWVHALDAYLDKHPFIHGILYSSVKGSRASSEYKKRIPSLSESFMKNSLYSAAALDVLASESSHFTEIQRNLLTLSVEMLKFLNASKNLEALQVLCGAENDSAFNELIHHAKSSTIEDNMKNVEETMLNSMLSPESLGIIQKNLNQEDQDKIASLFKHMAHRTAQIMVKSKQDHNIAFSSLVIQGGYKYKNEIANNELKAHYERATGEKPSADAARVIQDLLYDSLGFEQWKKMFKKAWGSLEKHNNIECKTRFFRDAEKLDATRSKPYWTTNVELIARSINAVTDMRMLEKDGVVNDFATLIGRPGLFGADEFLGSPNPEGEEAKRMSLAFEPLLQSLSTYAHGLHSEIKKFPSHSPN